MKAQSLRYTGPRHALRAQGRSDRLSVVRANSKTAGSDAFRERLLNYLSQSAGLTERSLLEKETVFTQGSSSRAARMLDTWLKKTASDTTRASLDQSQSGSDDDTSGDDEFVYMPKAQYDLQESPEWLLPGTRAAWTQPRARVNPRLESQVEIKPGRGGERSETYPNGTRLVKDSLGHVREIVAVNGSRCEFYYDQQGHLSSFVRLDGRGQMDSRAEVDRHGVIVRDAAGRVKAQGESMQVDPFGCITISRADGQFWSLDLVRSVHIERRLLPDEFGRWISMTALFSVDGFRMATRFTPLGKEKSLPRIQGGSGSYRFYGRDGSVIGFDSDLDLEHLRPNGVLPPGTRAVGNKHWGRRQAGTAWESLREYVGNYLAAL